MTSDLEEKEEELTKAKNEIESLKKKLQAASQPASGGIRQSQIRQSQVNKQAGGGDRKF